MRVGIFFCFFCKNVYIYGVFISCTMEVFKERLWNEYPIPAKFSIWQGDGVNTLSLKSLDSLIEMSVEDVATDLVVIDNITTSSMQTRLPDDTVTVMYGTMNYYFGGNRQVKVAYDKPTHQALMRYFPATITYQRKMHLEDIPNLQGDRLIYFRSYVLWKMAEGELSFLKTMNMNLDNATINLEVLEKFMNERKDKVELLRESILMYSPTNG